MPNSKLPAVAPNDFSKFAAKFKWPTEPSFDRWASAVQQNDAKIGASGAPVERVLIGFDEAASYCKRTGAHTSYAALWKLVQEKAA
jgi:hypothetical protein